MSISLNDHENRIKSLENKLSSNNSGSYTEVVLWEGSAYYVGQNLDLRDNVSKFDLISVECGVWYDGGARISYMFPKSQINRMYVMTGDRHYVVGKISDRQLRIINRASGSDDDRIRTVIGIKLSKVILYYFSNIIYNKIILRIISSLRHIFTSPILVNGGEILWRLA